MIYHAILLLSSAVLVLGHGRVTQPPSRASAWRYGYPTPANYDDDGLNCGGFSTQWSGNRGKCGICGDAYNLATPRPHELGGTYGQGVIVAQYLPGATIATTTHLTASHMGYWEFKLCPDPTDDSQECFDRHTLELDNGDTKYTPTRGSGIYNVDYKLPGGLVCEHCVLQWRYVAGNNWGICSNGTAGLGCGNQEEFRACSDIAIGVSKTLNDEAIGNEIPSPLFFYLQNGYFELDQGYLMHPDPKRPTRPQRPNNAKPSKRQPKPSQLQPNPSQRQPTPSQLQPNPSQRQPTPSQLQPNPSQRQPTPSQLQPNPSQRQPTPSQLQPNPSQRQPTPSQLQPNPSQRQPTPSQLQPNPSQRQPTPSQLQPNPSQRKPTPSQLQSNYFQQQPNPPQRQPNQSQQQPKISQQRPYPAQRRPTPSQQRPNPSQLQQNPFQLQPNLTQQQHHPSQRQPNPPQRQPKPSQRPPNQSQRQAKSSQRKPKSSKRQRDHSQRQSKPSRHNTKKTKQKTKSKKRKKVPMVVNNTIA